MSLSLSASNTRVMMIFKAEVSTLGGSENSELIYFTPSHSNFRIGRYIFFQWNELLILHLETI